MPAQLHHGGEVVDGHHGEIDFQLDAVDEQDGSRLLGEFLQATRRNPRREQHEAVDLAEQVECGGEFVRRVTRVVGDEHAVPVGGGAVVHLLDDVEEVRVRQVRQDHAHVPQRPEDESAGGGAGPVGQLIGDLVDPGREVRGHRRAAAHDTGDGGDRDPGCLRYGIDRDATARGHSGLISIAASTSLVTIATVYHLVGWKRLQRIAKTAPDHADAHSVRNKARVPSSFRDVSSTLTCLLPFDSSSSTARPNSSSGNVAVCSGDASTFPDSSSSAASTKS